MKIETASCLTYDGSGQDSDIIGKYPRQDCALAGNQDYNDSNPSHSLKNSINIIKE